MDGHHLPGTLGLFTTFSADTPDVERFAQVRSYQCSYLRANAHVRGQNLLTSEGIYHQHLTTNIPGNCAECLTEFTPMIGFLRSRFDQGQAMVAHPAPGVEDAQQEMEIYLASFA